MHIHTTERFIFSSILLILLAVTIPFTSPFPYLCFLLYGILMVVFVVRSLSDHQGIVFSLSLLLFSFLFSALSQGVLPYLIFCECTSVTGIQLLLPAIIYFLFQWLVAGAGLPQILYHVLILLLASTGIVLCQFLMSKYFLTKSHMDKAIQMTAVSEMYTKKLNQKLAIKNYLADKNARLEEREAISRNIHNSVGHSVTAAIMTLDAADMLFDTAPDRAREKVNAANTRIRTALNSIRHAVRVLDNETDTLSICDFILELTAVIDSFVQDTMVQVQKDFSDVNIHLSIPCEHTEFLAGALKECLTNGVRHGHADRFTVILNADSRHIRLKVQDNGKSDFSVQNAQNRIQNGFGLKKLISYAEKCGGSAIFENRTDFQSTITLPLYKEDENE